MRRIALFAEGQAAPDARGLGDEFTSLWTEILARAGVRGSLKVHGFHKGHVVSMTPALMRYEPIDLLIKRVHAKQPFDVLVIAFDREPRHQGLQRSCRHEEVDMLLAGLGGSTNLPAPFRADAAKLRSHYSANPRRAPRRPGRPPRLSVDVVCMEPCFEGILLEDQSGLRDALGLKGKKVREWPKWDTRTARPDREVIAKAIACAVPEVRRMMRKPFLEDKHGWARFLFGKLPDESPVWSHAVIDRLRTVLA
jgi:hypothetical protein